MGVFTDGAPEMTGILQFFAPRVQRAALSPAIIRVWCDLHQLDLAMQDFHKSVLSKQLYTYLTDLVCYLHCQQNLIVDMHSQCSLAFDTRGMNMGKVCKWCDLHRVRFMAYLGEKQPSITPPPMWGCF